MLGPDDSAILPPQLRVLSRGVFSIGNGGAALFHPTDMRDAGRRSRRPPAACASDRQGRDVITIEHETGVASVVQWLDRFEKQRPLMLSAGMIACHDKLQREGEVVHALADRLRT